MRWNGKARDRGRARGRVHGCAPRRIRSKAVPARSCWASSPSASSICRERSSSSLRAERSNPGATSRTGLLRRYAPRNDAYSSFKISLNTRFSESLMPLLLTEEQSMLRDSARGLISDKAPIAHLRKLRDDRDAAGFSRELWTTFADMGFAGLLIPEEHGGSGLGAVEAGVIMEEIGRTLMPSPFLATSVIAAASLTRGGSAAQ